MNSQQLLSAEIFAVIQSSVAANAATKCTGQEESDSGRKSFGDWRNIVCFRALLGGMAPTHATLRHINSL